MIAMALYFSAAVTIALACADDAHAIPCRFGRDTERLQAVGHHLYAVALLDAQFPGPAKPSFAAGAGGGDEQRGKFVDGKRHEAAWNGDAAQIGMTHANVGDRLAAKLAFVQQRNVRTHHAQDLDDPGARRIDPDIEQHDVGAGRNAGADHEKGRRRNISRNLDARPGEPRPSSDASASAFALHRISECP